MRWQALDVPTRFNVSGQQAEECPDGVVLVLGIDTGHDDFAAPQVERELAAGIDTQRLPDGLGQRDLALGSQRGDFVDGWHGGRVVRIMDIAQPQNLIEAWGKNAA